MATTWYDTGTSSTWPAWNSVYCAVSDTSTAITGAATALTNLGLVWRAWDASYFTAATTSTSNYTVAWGVWNDQYEQTAEQRQAALEQQRVWQEQQRVQAEQRRLEAEQAAKERAEADKVAEELLLEHLTPEQVETYQKGQYIMVASDDGQRTYRMFKNKHGAELMGADGRPEKHYCVYVPNVPRGDDLLGRKLMFQYAEDEAIRKANMTDLRGRA